MLIAEGLAGATASYLWWPASRLHVAHFYVLLGLVALHLGAVAGHAITSRGVLGRMGLGAASGRRQQAARPGEDMP
ncbi:hypothetical protein D3273_14620 [Lichenibacterium minor]|uniref:Uncharacterized protein n=1 Tax=Lichenibacterium minor TaxID=2316528 RepID=A0A4Q2U8X0_9HYPH|nr:hypothetical protein [Lichenibacterium minor]RYC31345.1 hypothetical protein D3273_14620 [Lichenibacterium minor]